MQTIRDNILNVTLAVQEKNIVPYLISSLQPEQIVALDVRPVIALGIDPLQILLKKIKTLETNQALKIINTFEPTPFIILLQEQGFESYANVINEDLVETYFYKKTITGKQTQDAQ